MDAIPAGREDQDQAQVAPIQQVDSTTVIRPLAGILRRFADAYIKIGDVTKAYLLTHRDCKSANQAKARGRKLLQDPRLQAYCAQVRTQAIVSTDTGSGDADKLAWEMELRAVAFASFNAKKVPVKEKVSALRTLGESKGYLKQQQHGAGLRATFNFVVGGTRRAAVGRTVTVDVDTEQSAAGAVGVDLDPALPQTPSALRSNPTKDVVFDLSSDSESESESDVRLSDRRRSYDGQPRADDGQPLAGRAQSRLQVPDSTGSTPKQAGKEANAGGQATSRSTPTGRPRASDSRQSARKGLFGVDNT